MGEKKTEEKGGTGKKNVKMRKVQLFQEVYYLNLPMPFVKAMAIQPGDEMVMIMDAGEIRVTPIRRNHGVIA